MDWIYIIIGAAFAGAVEGFSGENLDLFDLFMLAVFWPIAAPFMGIKWLAKKGKKEVRNEQ